MSKRTFNNVDQKDGNDEKSEKKAATAINCVLPTYSESDAIKALKNCARCRVWAWYFVGLDVCGSSLCYLQYRFPGTADRSRNYSLCESCVYKHFGKSVLNVIIRNRMELFDFLLKNDLMLQTEDGSYRTLLFVFEMSKSDFTVDRANEFRLYVMNSKSDSWYYRFKPCIQIWENLGCPLLKYDLMISGVISVLHAIRDSYNYGTSSQNEHQLLSMYQFTEHLLLDTARIDCMYNPTSIEEYSDEINDEITRHADHIVTTRKFVQRYLREIGVPNEIGWLICGYYVELSPL
jgi:hypothetical protein